MSARGPVNMIFHLHQFHEKGDSLRKRFNSISSMAQGADNDERRQAGGQLLRVDSKNPVGFVLENKLLSISMMLLLLLGSCGGSPSGSMNISNSTAKVLTCRSTEYVNKFNECVPCASVCYPCFFEHIGCNECHDLCPGFLDRKTATQSTTLLASDGNNEENSQENKSSYWLLLALCTISFCASIFALGFVCIYRQSALRTYLVKCCGNKEREEFRSLESGENSSDSTKRPLSAEYTAVSTESDQNKNYCKSLKAV